ncbi:MAG: 4Fe-4S binding protein [Nitrososphaerota archaeon]|jgi:2-oxoisovalerate ferredoxin oxidoreductase delta subunit|uniref:4Fe-4S binding protein n=1 Tax=Candidatus Bathycorpusculum sp. TaxID=2994959 RepID=UPI002839557E|nr:4Fe-4S binding protein [Candidatus Termiticorpusculum sp.]MCL2256669.1 4Fe-4S binding protein [Candidatus Termiticorpusculum sp.]MCL2292792.1 4Fe-4S binding protein [Candidatus Termiticorpusculum sp.]MDR0460421.1 4Fe-4S binding protein [Nitrososphaerota archaeon]
MSKQQQYHGSGWKNLVMAAVSQKPSTDFLTGDWKTFMPVADFEKCVTCLTCVMLCPEGAARLDSNTGKVYFDLNFCKGCGICAAECPTKAIVMQIPEKDKAEE